MDGLCGVTSPWLPQALEINGLLTPKAIYISSAINTIA